MLKRCLDIVFSVVGLIIAVPVLVPTLIAVWAQDGHSPFYTPKRVGQNGKSFTMLKIRSMIVDADKSRIDSTKADDDRITPVGHFIRRAKLDEVMQLANVLIGTMSLVGPRPNIDREVALYTEEEQKLLSVKPGITDPASIVFSDLAEILEGQQDANIAYNQLVRPWKSRVSLFYIENATPATDIRVIFCTVLLLASRQKSLEYLSKLMIKLGASKELVRLTQRHEPLRPTPPPGALEIVTSRNLPN